jgi:predicted AlkP superfamily pyrophosphatase or phosphodiesterase
MSRLMVVLFTCVGFVVGGGCAGSSKRKAAGAQPRAVVLWISVDGVRGDYVDRVRPPFLGRLVREGASTRQLRPVFPSLTFPSHLSEATGVTPAVHGIPSNSFYDSITDTTYEFPDDASLVQAEPIWLTAQRQGVRTAVFDWPMSQHQERLPAGTPRCAYFNDHYDTKLSDTDRLGRVLATYQKDSRWGRQPLRLLMGYVHDVDTAGHRFGPDSPQVDEALLKTDRTLEQVVMGVTKEFDRRMKPKRGDRLYVLITTDHGMSPVETLVNLERLVGDALPPPAKVINSGSLAHVYLDPLPPEMRGNAQRAILEKLKEYPFVHAWSAERLPAEFGYAHPSRTGDVVVSLDRGYTFTKRKDTPATMPARLAPTEAKGMHGYRPDENPEMLGFAVLWQYPRPASVAAAGQDLGEVNALRLHPTVAGILGISPAPAAQQRPLAIPGMR